MFAVALKMFKASPLSMEHVSGVVVRQENLAIMVPGSMGDVTTSELWSVGALVIRMLAAGVLVFPQTVMLRCASPTLQR